jgi:predicted ATP-grasp superfamily ATP-dependent carboligase
MSEAPSAILIHEHITGGGWPADLAHPPLVHEALAIARAVAAAFRRWGRLPVVMTRDARLGAHRLPADEVVSVTPACCRETLEALTRRCGAVLVVAPETGGVLESVSGLVEETGALLLGSPASAVATAADKWAFGERLREAGLPTPRTVRVDAHAAPAAVAELGYPLMVKPVRGAGCEGVARVDDAAELRKAIEALGSDLGGSLLLQDYVDGAAVSVSLLVAEGRAQVLALNSQDVRAGTPYTYRGGVSGIEHERGEEACELARAAVSLVPGLRGLVGVDLVIGEHGCSLIEVNARVTTSIVGLGKAIDLDVAAAVWRACRHGELPKRVGVRRPVSFTVESSDAL